MSTVNYAEGEQNVKNRGKLEIYADLNMSQRMFNSCVFYSVERNSQVNKLVSQSLAQSQPFFDTFTQNSSLFFVYRR